MLQRRTDLALEAREIWQESAQKEAQIEGVEMEESRREGFPVTTVRVTNERGAKALD